MPWSPQYFYSGPCWDLSLILLIVCLLTLLPVMSWPATRLKPLLSLDIFFLLNRDKFYLSYMLTHLSLSSSLISRSLILLQGPVSACSSLDP